MLQKKICILGPTAVGKTSLIRKFVEGIFSEKYLTSIGVKIDKKVVITESADVKLMIWDIEGIDRYCGFNPKYLRGASVFVVVMDQTRSQSLVEAMEILSMAREHSEVPAVMVVNKCDLDAKWHWHDDQILEHQGLYDGTFFTSAKTGENVSDMFSHIAKLSIAQ